MGAGMLEVGLKRNVERVQCMHAAGRGTVER